MTTEERDPANAADVTAEVFDAALLSIQEGLIEMLAVKEGLEEEGIIASYDDAGNVIRHWKISVAVTPYEEKTDSVESDGWEYRALAKEPDTGKVYDSLGPFAFETEARNEADIQDLTRESDGSLPPLVLKIERRRKATAWEPLP